MIQNHGGQTNAGAQGNMCGQLHDIMRWTLQEPTPLNTAVHKTGIKLMYYHLLHALNEYLLQVEGSDSKEESKQ